MGVKKIRGRPTMHADTCGRAIWLFGEKVLIGDRCYREQVTEMEAAGGRCY